LDKRITKKPKDWSSQVLTSSSFNVLKSEEGNNVDIIIWTNFGRGTNGSNILVIGGTNVGRGN
jgi:hypothetical protein